MASAGEPNEANRDILASSSVADVGRLLLKEDDTRRDLSRHNRPVSNYVHPLVYAAVVGLVIWFVLTAWIFFGGAEYMGLLLAMVSGFFLMAMAIPFALWLVWRKHRPGAPHQERSVFAEWVSGQFETATGRRNAMGAAIEILLPLAAAATGMTAMGSSFISLRSARPSSDNGQVNRQVNTTVRTTRQRT